MPFSTTYSKLKTFVNGGKVFPSDLDDALDDVGNQIASVNVAGGFNEGSNVRRGKCIVPGTETRTNTAYGLMPTPDQVQNVVLPTDGLIHIAYQAIWQESVGGAARAAIFIGANQLKIAASAVLAPQNAREGGFTAVLVNTDTALASNFAGLNSADPPAGGTPVATGQVVGVTATNTYGSWVTIFAAAGTYTISVQFKSSSGSVTAKSRKLWVRSESFG